MALLLERVQLKFAHIVADLSLEPLILSQFAVWVDLKIAEYKANGVISLDCEGCRPEPTWMKGVIPLEKSQDLSREEPSVSNPKKGIGVEGEINPDRSGGITAIRNIPVSTASSSDGLSSEHVVVKQEPPSLENDAFPLAFYRNTSCCTFARKRIAVDRAGTCRSTSKFVRMVTASSTPETSSNPGLLPVKTETICDSVLPSETPLVHHSVPYICPGGLCSADSERTRPCQVEEALENNTKTKPSDSNNGEAEEFQSKDCRQCRELSTNHQSSESSWTDRSTQVTSPEDFTDKVHLLLRAEITRRVSTMDSRSDAYAPNPPLKCVFCPYGCTSRSGLGFAKHICAHAFQRDCIDSTKCPICYAEFPSLEELVCHSVCHSVDVDFGFGCELCTYRAIKKARIRQHMRQIHGIHVTSAS